MIRTFNLGSHLVCVPNSWTAFRFRGLVYLRRQVLRAGGLEFYWVTSDGREWREARRDGQLTLEQRKWRESEE